MARVPVISVVDDDASVRESLRSLLRSAGLCAESFASGLHFLDSEALHRTDCLVLDVDMPEMTGPELQRELNARDQRIPIIFITAHGDETLRRRVLADGAAAFLRKPFDEDALLDEIQTALRGGGFPDGGTADLQNI